MVLGSGNEEMTGAVVSTTWMTWLAMLLLPQWSVAVQVRVTSWFCAHEPGVVTSAKVRVGLGSHASVAVGVAKDGEAGHSMVVGAGTAERSDERRGGKGMTWREMLVVTQWSVA